jgi:hypothetical protein
VVSRVPPPDPNPVMGDFTPISVTAQEKLEKEETLEYKYSIVSLF